MSLKMRLVLGFKFLGCDCLCSQKQARSSYSMFRSLISKQHTLNLRKSLQWHLQLHDSCNPLDDTAQTLSRPSSSSYQRAAAIYASLPKTPGQKLKVGWNDKLWENKSV